jgi:Mce-associated membrane protein
VSDQSKDENVHENVKDEPVVPADADTKAAELDETVESTEPGEKQADEPAEKTDTPAESTEPAEKQADEPAEKTDTPAESTEPAEQKAEPERPKRRIPWSRIVAFGVLPALALLLAVAAGFLKWQDNAARVGEMPPSASEKHPSPAAESVRAAQDNTIALLSYKADTVEQQLTAARDLLTGDFRGQYTSLTNDVVIPGAKQKRISAVATVPAAASVSADPNHAVVLVFVYQTVTVGQDAPTDTASSVRVTLDKIGGRWLISKFDPV